jgi:hypothetical protein
MFEKNADGKVREELNFLERNSGYGIATKGFSKEHDGYIVNVVSLKEDIIIKKGEDGKVVPYYHQCVMQRVLMLYICLSV